MVRNNAPGNNWTGCIALQLTITAKSRAHLGNISLLMIDYENMFHISHSFDKFDNSLGNSLHITPSRLVLV